MGAKSLFVSSRRQRKRSVRGLYGMRQKAAAIFGCSYPDRTP
jgi:hypothetical protein